MISRGLQSSLWRTTRHTWRALLGTLVLVLLATLLFRWYRGVGSLEDTRSRLLLTLVGLCAGVWLADILAAGVRRFPRTVVLGCAAVAVSQVLYLVLVWSEWKPYAALWRAWWVALVAAVTLAHVTWAGIVLPGPRDWVARATPLAAGICGAMLALVALRRELLAPVHPALIAGFVPPALVAVAGSVVLWVRARRRRPRTGMPRWRRIGWIGIGTAGVFGFGFYAGRVTAPPPVVTDLGPSPLAHLTPAELDAAVAADLQRLKAVCDGIDALAARSEAFRREMDAKLRADDRAYYLPAEEDELRAQFMTYLAYRSALLRMVAAYAGFESVARPDARARCFLVGYGAGATCLRASTLLVATYREWPMVRRKLNEGDETCGIRPGEFDRIYAAVTDERNLELFERMSRYRREHRARWQSDGVLPPEQLAWVDDHIARAEADVRALGGSLDRTTARLEQLATRVRADVGAPVYDAQSFISTLIGDTRMVKRPAFISRRQVLSIQPQLRPGDILLERRNWYASNAFLPGFWPHAAIYVGTVEDLERLGLARRTKDGTWTSDEPAVRDRLPRYFAAAHDGEPHTVLESVSEGVIFNSLTESMGADYVAALRPRLSEADRARAIAHAFAHEGKPYDFEFDFFSADKLVCTELVYRSYDGLLRFDLVRIMGRDTLPALEICRKFAGERDRPDRELDFVLFLDAVPEQGLARFATADDFCASAHRPRGFNE